MLTPGQLAVKSQITGAMSELEVMKAQIATGKSQAELHNDPVVAGVFASLQAAFLPVYNSHHASLSACNDIFDEMNGITD